MTLEIAKKYLRVDTEDDDELINGMLESAEKMCLDILRNDKGDEIPDNPEFRIGILYAVAYMYEHREEADHGKLKKTLRDILCSDRREVF